MWALLLSRATDPPNSFFDRRQLDAGQLKIGRNERMCDLLLPDNTGFVSREHCTISVSGLDVFVVDTSKNGVCLNQIGARIVPNQPVPIRAHDRLYIGDFVITLLTASEAAGIGVAPLPPIAAAQPTPATPPPASQDNWFQPAPDPFWSTGGAGSEVHEFLSNSVIGIPQPPVEPLAGGPSRFGFGDPFGEAFSRPIMAEPLLPPADFGIPENWADGFQNQSPSSYVAPPLNTPNGAPAFGTPAVPPFSAPSFTGGMASIPDPSFAVPPLVNGLGSPSAQPSSSPPQIGGFGAPQGQPIAPPSFAASPAPQVEAQQASGPAGSWDAFYEGAGLSPDELKLPPDAMYKLGVMYRQVVLGLCDILQDRAAFKDEFRVERTQLSIGQNNPLKHLPAIEVARALLSPSLPGFMSSEDAVRSSLEDVKRHQLALLAGVQQALVVAFERLSPREVETLVEKAEAKKKGFLRLSGVDRWGVYVTLFEALRKDATSNANGIMSVAFREGYEKFMKSSR